MTSPVTRHLLNSHSMLHAPLRPVDSGNRRACSRLRKQSGIPSRSASPATRHPSLVTRRISAAFTLIELLVVIAIIAILAGLAFPAVQGALGGSRKAQARNDVQQIAAAVRAFELEYGRQPSTETTTDTWLDDNSVLMKTLLGEDPALNPRNKRFLEPKLTTSTKGGINSSTKVFYDPWGTPYGIKLNTDYDNNIEYYGSNAVSVIVLSYGPDKAQGNPGGSAKIDDIFSYR